MLDSPTGNAKEGRNREGNPSALTLWLQDPEREMAMELLNSWAFTENPANLKLFLYNLIPMEAGFGGGDKEKRGSESFLICKILWNIVERKMGENICLINQGTSVS